jgi:hypothetical protein
LKEQRSTRREALNERLSVDIPLISTGIMQFDGSQHRSMSSWDISNVSQLNTLCIWMRHLVLLPGYLR